MLDAALDASLALVGDFALDIEVVFVLLETFDDLLFDLVLHLVVEELLVGKDLSLLLLGDLL